jgi:plasmid stabilization system protein ParE
VSGYLVTPAADADLDELWERVAGETGAARADRPEGELHAAMCRIGDMPGIGHSRDDLADESLRILVVHAFLIVYRPDTRPPQVIRVLHGARDVQAILGPAKPGPTTP